MLFNPQWEFLPEILLQDFLLNQLKFTKNYANGRNYKNLSLTCKCRIFSVVDRLPEGVVSGSGDYMIVRPEHASSLIVNRLSEKIQVP